MNAGLAYLDGLKLKRMPDATLSISAGTLALILLLLYVNQRSRQELLFLALYGSLLVVRRGDNYWLITPDSTPWRHPAWLSVVPPMYAFLAEFATKFFRLKVVESVSASGELFGFERTREISGKSASDIAARLWGHTDDITVVTVRRAAPA